ncbi:MAG: hypothetical protein ACJ741_10475 [Pyrinomonadaceae bacterium]
MITAVLAALALGVVAVCVGRAAADTQAPRAQEPPLHQGGYLNSYIALLKSDLKARKAGYISEGLRLSDQESVAFRPIYLSYEADVKRLDDARLQLTQEYADHYDKMTDAKAVELIEKRLALEAQRVETERTYFKRVAKVLPGKRAARFFQLEYRFRLMLDLKGVSEIPLIE